MAYVSFLRGKIFRLIVSILVSLVLYPPIVHSEVFNVTDEDELREALSIAESNGEDDVINIAAGLYITGGEPFRFETDEDFALTIEGEGAGLTILDGGEVSRVLNINSLLGEQRVSTILKLSKLSIQNGFASVYDVPGPGLGDGAGIIIRNMNYVTIEDTEFRNNNADRLGAGISIFISQTPIQVNLSNNIFTENTAFGGGGVEITVSENGEVNLSNNVFVDNSALVQNGGGAAIGGGSIVLVQNKFLGNSSNSTTLGGGGASIGGESLVISNNEFLNNTCGSYGGALRVLARGLLKMTDNRFIENSARLSGGGASIFSKGEATMSGNMFTGNSVFLLPSEQDGGGGGADIAISDEGETDVSLTNNIFTQNSSTRDGGALNVRFPDCINQPVEQVIPEPQVTPVNPTPTPTPTPTCPPTSTDNVVLTNNTFTLNSSELSGGALSISESVSKDNSVNIYNNVVYDNMANGVGGDIYIKGGLNITNIRLRVNLFNNDFSDSFITCENLQACLPDLNEGDNIDEDPLFVDAESGDVSLQADSPCIDAGDLDAPHLPNTDFFGNPRVPPPDMGAVEFIGGEAQGGGGCSIAHTPVTSSLAVFLAIPVLILMRRIVKRQRR